MDIDKMIELSILYDYYGELLTPKQRDVVNLYYNEDYSLGEISEDLGISRQAVYDTLKRSVKILQDYELKLGFIERFNSKNEAIKTVCDGLEELGDKALKCGRDDLSVDIQKLTSYCRELLK